MQKSTPHQHLLETNLRNNILSLHHIFLVTQTNSGTMQEITQEFKYQEMVITGEYFEDGYYSSLSGSQQVTVPPRNM